MRRVALLALLALLVGGCTDSAQEVEAKKAVAARFDYPGSARFQRVREVNSGGVCGEVNGRQLAGESGFRRFYWSPKAGPTIEGLGAKTGIQDIDVTLAHIEDSTISIGCK